MATESDSSGKIRTVWECQLGAEVFESWWDNVILAILSSTPCARLWLVQFEVLNSQFFKFPFI